MNKKLIKTTIFSAIVAFAAILIAGINVGKRLTGEQVFEGVAGRINEIGEISFSTEEWSVTIFPQDNLWRVKEANNYFANYLMINELISSMQESRFFKRIEGVSELDGIRLKIKDKNNKLLSDITIGEPINDTTYAYVKMNNTNDVYIASNLFELPEELPAWLEQPIAQILLKDVEAITTNKNTASRADRTQPLLNVKGREINTDIIQKIIVYFFFEDVVSEEHFNKENFPKQTKISFTMFNGLIHEFTIYTNEEEFWVSKNLSKTKLPTADVSDYIKSNQFLYEGWYFKIPNHIGNILFNYNI